MVGKTLFLSVAMRVFPKEIGTSALESVDSMRRSAPSSVRGCHRVWKELKGCGGRRNPFSPSLLLHLPLFLLPLPQPISLLRLGHPFSPTFRHGSSCSQVFGLQDSHQYPLFPSWFQAVGFLLGVTPSTPLFSHLWFWLNPITTFPGSPAYRYISWNFSASIIVWDNSCNKSPRIHLCVYVLLVLLLWRSLIHPLKEKLLEVLP